MKRLLESIKKCASVRVAEDAPTNAVGGGFVHGLGVGDRGEPGVRKKKRLRIFTRKKPNGPGPGL